MLVRAKYQVGDQFSQRRVEFWAWKIARTMTPPVHQYRRHKIGNGKGTRIWYHPWLLDKLLLLYPTHNSTELVSWLQHRLAYVAIHQHIRDINHLITGSFSINYHSQRTLHNQIMSFGPHLQIAIDRLWQYTACYRNQLAVHKHHTLVAWSMHGPHRKFCLASESACIMVSLQCLSSQPERPCSIHMCALWPHCPWDYAACYFWSSPISSSLDFVIKNLTPQKFGLNENDGPPSSMRFHKWPRRAIFVTDDVHKTQTSVLLTWLPSLHVFL